MNSALRTIVPVLEVFAPLHGGDLGERPFVLPYFNPASPASDRLTLELAQIP